MVDIGKIVHDKREELHMSQEELARRLGVTRQAISKWECGKNYPDIYSLKGLAEVLKLDIEELLELDKTIQQEKPKRKKKRDIILILISSAVAIIGAILLVVFMTRPKPVVFNLLKTEYTFTYGITIDKIEAEITQNIEYDEQKNSLFFSGIQTGVGSYYAYVNLDNDSKWEHRISITIRPNPNGLIATMTRWELNHFSQGDTVYIFLDLYNYTGQKILVNSGTVTLTDGKGSTVLSFTGEIPNWTVENNQYITPLIAAYNGFDSKYLENCQEVLYAKFAFYYTYV